VQIGGTIYIVLRAILYYYDRLSGHASQTPLDRTFLAQGHGHMPSTDTSHNTTVVSIFLDFSPPYGVSV